MSSIIPANANHVLNIIIVFVVVVVVVGNLLRGKFKVKHCRHLVLADGLQYCEVCGRGQIFPSCVPCKGEVRLESRHVQGQAQGRCPTHCRRLQPRRIVITVVAFVGKTDFQVTFKGKFKVKHKFSTSKFHDRFPVKLPVVPSHFSSTVAAGVNAEILNKLQVKFDANSRLGSSSRLSTRRLR